MARAIRPDQPIGRARTARECYRAAVSQYSYRLGAARGSLCARRENEERRRCICCPAERSAGNGGLCRSNLDAAATIAAKGKTFFATLTAPHGLAAKIESAAANPAPSIAVLQKPILGVVLGGPSGGARYDEASAVALADEVKAAMKDFASLAITPSRRTPPEFLAAFRSALDGAASFFWEGEGYNPYTDILGNAASLIVAADSHNMMSEAAATTAGVYAWRP